MSTVVSFNSGGGSRKGAMVQVPQGRQRRGKMGMRQGTSVVSRAMSSVSRARSRDGSAATVVSLRRAPSVVSQASVMSRQPIITPVRAAAYWDALINTVPPSLTTTYGAYTCVNSVVRFTFTTAPNLPTQFLFAWTPTPSRTFLSEGVLTSNVSVKTWAQQQLLSAINTAPLDIRPLRMSVRAANTTAAINRAGSITTTLVPQSILQNFIGANNMSSASWASQWALAQNSPASRRLTASELQKSHVFVMPPSSYLAYNTYADYVSTSTDNGAPFSAADFNAIVGLDPAALVVYPYIPKGGYVGSIPTNNLLLINIEPNPLAQSFDFVVSCQDAVRYPANSLPASMAQKYDGSLTSDVLSQHTAQQATAENVHPHDSISQAGSVVGGILGSRLGSAAGGPLGPAGIAVGNFIGGMLGTQMGGYVGGRIPGVRG